MSMTDQRSPNEFCRGGPGQQDFLSGGQGTTGLGLGRLPIAQFMAFIHDHDVPRQLGEQIEFVGQQRVRGQDCIVGCVRFSQWFSLLSVIDRDFHGREELFLFFFPFAQQGWRQHNQGRRTVVRLVPVRPYMRQGLNGLADRHVIGKHHADTGVHARAQPGHSFKLIRP